MDDRTTHIVLVVIGLGLFSLVYRLAPVLYRKWQPTGGFESAAHGAIGWIGRYFWHIWAALMVSTIAWWVYTDAIMYGR